MFDFLRKFYLLLLVVLLLASCSEKNNNQKKESNYVFINDFENDSCDFIWKNVNRVEDHNSYSGDYVSECKPETLYAFGFDLESDTMKYHNALISIDMMLRSNAKPSALFVVSLQKDDANIFWHSFPLSEGYVSENEWYKNSIELNLPYTVLEDTKFNCYVLNNGGDHLFIDDFKLNINYYVIPSFIDEIKEYNTPARLKNITDADNLNVYYSKQKKNIVLADADANIITKPLSMTYSLIKDNDTVKIQFADWELLDKDSVLLFKNNNDIVDTELSILFDADNTNVNFYLHSEYKTDVDIIKSSLILPFNYDDFVVYRRNPFVDSCDFQDVYYLDREGFSLRLPKKQLVLYHPENVSSIQLDVENAVAHINTDFYYDHLLLRYELSDTLDFYVDNSFTSLNEGDAINSSFSISLTAKSDLPRIMPINYGYESAFIWTEHADWADIKTHRATYFGSEDVTDIDEAVGGFAYYDIPVTKSVFYHNPDSVTNYNKNANFPGLHSTIKTDDLYFEFLKQLNDNGFEICLHTPEQYTSNRESMSEALSFMKEHFASPTWIDHGYNNSATNNREDLVCDGLDSTSPYYSYDLWKEHGVKYLFNASYEEMRPRPFAKYTFRNEFVRPHPSYGDALPMPKVVKLHSYPDILLWSTPYTTEHSDNSAWNYYFNQERLDNIVDLRYVFITHIYAPWVEEYRGFWEMKDGKIVAKDGFNKALERLANMRDKHYLLPTTIENYMTYQEQLQQLEYKLDANGNVLLKNNNEETIKGLSLISTKKMSLADGKSFNIRKTKNGNEYIIWFDMEPNEELTINN